jgi:hypothetical protein
MKLPQAVENYTVIHRGTAKEVGCRAAAPPKTPKNRNLKNTDFYHIMISEGLHDFLFSRNQPSKSAGDSYIRIFKNKLVKLKKQEDTTL